jgi:hypothetical protein
LENRNNRVETINQAAGQWVLQVGGRPIGRVVGITRDQDRVEVALRTNREGRRALLAAGKKVRKVA